MSQPHTIALLLAHPATERGQRARRDLLATLDGATATEPDETGTFEVELEGGSYEQALELTWNAVAAAGAEEEVLFLEHPDIRHHWERRAERPEPGPAA